AGEGRVGGFGRRGAAASEIGGREPYPRSSAVGLPGTLVGSFGDSRQTAPAGALRSAARAGVGKGARLAASAEPAATKTLRRPRWGNIPVLQLQSSPSWPLCASARRSASIIASTCVLVFSS